MGQKYAVFDEAGFVKAFYDKDIHGDNIPDNAIEITEEQWRELINNQGRKYFDFVTKEVKDFNPDTMKVIDGRVVEKTTSEILQDRKNIKLDLLKSYVSFLLSQTDWVIVKLQSLQNEGWSEEIIRAEMQKYQPVLEKRKMIREWNSQVKQAIQNAQTIEELEAIRIEFEG